MSKKNFFILVLISFLALFFNIYKKQDVPPAFNADEAAFGYNSYSITQTGRDEYGNVVPLRLESFGDYKMPLYTYLSVPFVKVFGLSVFSTRLVNSVLVLFFPFVIFLLVKQFFDKSSVALFASFLTSTSWGLQSIGRQAHEGFLAVFFSTLCLLLFLRLVKKFSIHTLIFFLALVFLSLFSYQTSRLFVVYFFVLSCVYFFQKKHGKLVIASIALVFIVFTITDLVYQPKRVTNLLFFNTGGFAAKINELRAEGGQRLFYNKLTLAKKELLVSYAKYFSPQFLFISGDENPRFGFPDMGPITSLEYVLFFVGLYFLFRKREQNRFLIVSLLLIAPLPASLTWTGVSLTRSLFFLIPILAVVAYGSVQLYSLTPKQYRLWLVLFLVGAEVFALFYTWDFYFNHYPKRALVQRSWQAGYQDLVGYIRKNYSKFDHFYITKKHGQPYIFLLFYLKYPPQEYQKQARLSTLDLYGFGQVEAFDKFIFRTGKIPPTEKNYVLIGYPDDFNGLRINKRKIKKIKFKTEEIFWIYEESI